MTRPGIEPSSPGPMSGFLCRNYLYLEYLKSYNSMKIICIKNRRYVCKLLLLNMNCYSKLNNCLEKIE